MSGFAAGIGAALGVGATELTLTLDTPMGLSADGKPAFGGLEVVTGEVIVHGGSVEQSGRLIVYALEWWIVSTGKTTTRVERLHSKTELDAALSVEAKADGRAYPFALTLPDIPAGGHNWAIRAQFDVEGFATDRYACTDITMLPSAPLRGLVACLMRLGEFRSIGWGGRNEGAWGEGPPPGQSYLNFAPPREFASALDGVKFLIDRVALPPDGDEVVGTLDINPQEQSPLEYLTGGRKHEKKAFRFPATELAACAPGGRGRADTPAEVSPPYAHLVQSLGDLLWPYLDGGPQGSA